MIVHIPAPGWPHGIGMSQHRSADCVAERRQRRRNETCCRAREPRASRLRLREQGPSALAPWALLPRARQPYFRVRPQGPHRKGEHREPDNESGTHADAHHDNGGGVSGSGRGHGVGSDVPAAEHSPGVLGGQRRNVRRHGVRAALRHDHRAERLLHDHPGKQGWRRWPYHHLRADR